MAQRPGFVYTVRHERAGKVVDETQTHNLMPFEGINYMFDVAFGGKTQQSRWYVGLYTSPFAPTPDITMNDFNTQVPEMIGYTPANRPHLTFSASANGRVLSNEVELNITEEHTVYGAFLSSDQQKGGTAGILGSVVLFNTPKPYSVGDRVFIVVEQHLIST